MGDLPKESANTKSFAGWYSNGYFADKSTKKKRIRDDTGIYGNEDACVGDVVTAHIY